MNSKEIGSAFERLVCEKLSLWASDFKRKDIFWRSAGSGGRFTRARFSAASMAGDIVATDALGNALIERFVVECKDWRSLEFHLAFYREVDIIKAWRKVRNEAYSTKRFPMLICKEHRRPLLCILDLRGLIVLKACLKPEKNLLKIMTLHMHDGIVLDFTSILTDTDYALLKKQPCNSLFSPETGILRTVPRMNTAG